MKWNEVTIVTSTEGAELVSNELVAAGAQGTMIEDDWDYVHLQDDGFGMIMDKVAEPSPHQEVFVRAYYPDTSSFADTLTLLRKKVEELAFYNLPLGSLRIEVNGVKEEDWEEAWKQYYHPIRITRYLTVVPFWETYEKEQSDEILIRMDPGMAFGTGTHPTTRLALEALETVLRGGEKVLDVGTGSGVLAIASKALGAKSVFAYDIDHIATRQSIENVAMNEYAKDIQVDANNLLEGIQDAQADVIVANILAEILELMISDAWNNLKDDGRFILSGIIHSKKDALKDRLVAEGFQMEQEKQSGDWYCFICRKGEAA